MTGKPAFAPWPISPTFCPFNSLPTVDDLVRLDQIPRFRHLSPEDKERYHEQVSYLWNLIDNNAKDSQEFEYGFMELLGLSLGLKDDMQEFRKKEYGEYVRARKHESEDIRLLESAMQPSMTHQGKMIELEYHLSEFSPELRFQVDALKLYRPREMTEKEMEGWILETRLQYGRGIKEKQDGQKMIDDLADARITRQKAGANLNKEELQTYDMKIEEAQKVYSQALLTTFNLRLQNEKRKKEGGKICSKQKWP